MDGEWVFAQRSNNDDREGPSSRLHACLDADGKSKAEEANEVGAEEATLKDCVVDSLERRTPTKA